MLLSAFIYIVFALLLIVCALLLLVVLMQRPKQEGLGAAFGAQMTDQAFGAQTTDVLKKGTVLFGSLFMILCFILAVLMNRQFQNQKSGLANAAATAPAATQQQPAAATIDLDSPAQTSPTLVAPEQGTPAEGDSGSAGAPSNDVQTPSATPPAETAPESPAAEHPTPEGKGASKEAPLS